MTDFDWQAEATAAAQEIRDDASLSGAHRGAIPWRMVGVAAAFGNDDYRVPDGMAMATVETLRSCISRSQGPDRAVELGFATSADGHTWAMIVQIDDHKWLNRFVWKTYIDALKARVGEEHFETAANMIDSQIGIAVNLIMDWRRRRLDRGPDRQAPSVN